MRLVAFNRQIACEPFQRTGLSAEIQGKFAVVKQKSELVPLRVVFRDYDGTFDAGEIVYVKGEQVKAPWALEEYELDGKKFILVPVDKVQLVGSDV